MDPDGKIEVLLFFQSPFWNALSNSTNLLIIISENAKTYWYLRKSLVILTSKACMTFGRGVMTLSRYTQYSYWSFEKAGIYWELMENLVLVDRKKTVSFSIKFLLLSGHFEDFVDWCPGRSSTNVHEQWSILATHMAKANVLAEGAIFLTCWAMGLSQRKEVRIALSPLRDEYFWKPLTFCWKWFSGRNLWA